MRRGGGLELFLRVEHLIQRLARPEQPKIILDATANAGLLAALFPNTPVRVKQPTTPREHAQAYALTFPGAYAEHPWGQTVIKVHKKVFLFVNGTIALEDGVSLSVKLPHTGPDLLQMPFAYRAPHQTRGSHGEARSPGARGAWLLFVRQRGTSTNAGYRLSGAILNVAGVCVPRRSCAL